MTRGSLWITGNLFMKRFWTIQRSFIINIDKPEAILIYLNLYSGFINKILIYISGGRVWPSTPL